MVEGGKARRLEGWEVVKLGGRGQRGKGVKGMIQCASMTALTAALILSKISGETEPIPFMNLFVETDRI